MNNAPLKLSAVISVHNEENQLTECLKTLEFADEIVVLLDKCTDGSEAIAQTFTDRIVHGAWPKEGARRNAGIEACTGNWVFEIDADERVPEALAKEIRRTVETSDADWHEVPVDNYIGERLIRWGWGASFGKSAYPGLFRRGVKVWGDQRVHPNLTWSGRKGARSRTRGWPRRWTAPRWKTSASPATRSGGTPRPSGTSRRRSPSRGRPETG